MGSKARSKEHIGDRGKEEVAEEVRLDLVVAEEVGPYLEAREEGQRELRKQQRAEQKREQEEVEEGQRASRLSTSRWHWRESGRRQLPCTDPWQPGSCD
jgi:hypothetical protein